MHISWFFQLNQCRHHHKWLTFECPLTDDALVHTDDERISTMFNMLNQIARDQQIIVFSCRTRAFSDLGGERAFITELSEVS